MHRTLRRTRDVRSWLIASSVMTVFGCGTELPPPDPHNGLPPGVASEVGQYQKQIAAYAPTGPSHTRKRKAKCFLSLCSAIDVSIQALGNTLAIDPENAPDPAVPVAHLVNLDREKTEKFYGLLPQNQAVYDLWVSRIPGSAKAQWTLVKTTVSSGTITAAPPRDLNLCHRRGPNDPKMSDADFAENRYHGDCSEPIKPPGEVNRASLFPTAIFSRFLAPVAGVIAQAFRLQGGWIDCNNGCCT